MDRSRAPTRVAACLPVPARKQVFYAPHIARMSSAMGARFEPIRYVLDGATFTSNVKFSNALLGQGWLSAGGSLAKKYDDAVEVHFDR